jgi:hypothetical protein
VSAPDNGYQFRVALVVVTFDVRTFVMAGFNVVKDASGDCFDEVSP